MLLTRRDPLTGRMNTLDLPITPDQIAAWQQGQLIQHAMPHLTLDQREFLLTGLMPESWEAMFAEEDDGE